NNDGDFKSPLLEAPRHPRFSPSHSPITDHHSQAPSAAPSRSPLKTSPSTTQRNTLDTHPPSCAQQRLLDWSNDERACFWGFQVETAASTLKLETPPPQGRLL